MCKGHRPVGCTSRAAVRFSNVAATVLYYHYQSTRSWPNDPPNDPTQVPNLPTPNWAISRSIGLANDRDETPTNQSTTEPRHARRPRASGRRRGDQPVGRQPADPDGELGADSEAAGRTRPRAPWWCVHNSGSRQLSRAWPSSDSSRLGDSPCWPPATASFDRGREKTGRVTAISAARGWTGANTPRHNHPKEGAPLPSPAHVGAACGSACVRDRF